MICRVMSYFMGLMTCHDIMFWKFSFKLDANHFTLHKMYSCINAIPNKFSLNLDNVKSIQTRFQQIEMNYNVVTSQYRGETIAFTTFAELTKQISQDDTWNDRAVLQLFLLLLYVNMSMSSYTFDQLQNIRVIKIKIINHQLLQRAYHTHG